MADFSVCGWYLLGLWMVMVLFGFTVCWAFQDGLARLRRLHQIPCAGCAFFTGDCRLKCTVHPYRALSEEAIACRDFEPQVRDNGCYGVVHSPKMSPVKGIFAKGGLLGKKRRLAFQERTR